MELRRTRKIYACHLTNYYANKLYKENCQLKQQIVELQKNNQNKQGDSK